MVQETGTHESTVRGEADGSPGRRKIVRPARKAVTAWNPKWRDNAADMPCGNCMGRECGHCSIITGEADGPDGLPTSYVAKAIQYHEAKPRVTAKALRAAPDMQALVSSNPIVVENQNPGTPEDEWLIGEADSTIEGFAVQFSLNHGQTVDFKINTDSINYRIDIYRLGYYGGDGARLMATINRVLATPQVQPTPSFDAARRLVDAGNWAVSASWPVPAAAVSGVYFALLTRLDGSQGQSMIPFVVRDDADDGDIVFQTCDTTWQAYNWWGGYNLYGGIAGGGREGRSSAVSYNRPIITRDGGYASGPQDFIFSVEYPAIRWLERNGYHVRYIAGIDVASAPQRLSGGKVFLSIGHDEYWSPEQRNNVVSARDAGLHLAFLSGNEVYWQTRWEPSIDGLSTPFKTMVCYKERWDDANSDTSGTTSTWRDFQYGPGSEENALTGTIFTVDSYRLDAMEVPFAQSNLRFWRDTAVANTVSGQVHTLTQNLLGYEWDSDLDNLGRREGLINLSATTINVNTMLLDYGATIGDGTAKHALTLYKAASGAWVFGAGTVYWCWGLDANHDNEATPTDANVQQAMVNLFADMGVQPETLMAGLVAATQTTDVTAPTSVITSPLASGSFSVGVPIAITGTASDVGGLVASVEVSTDDGATWRRASGLESWSYTFTPLSAGSYTLRSRAVDDSLNMETPGAGVVITVTAAPLHSLFGAAETPAILTDADADFVTLGVRFTSSQPGTIVALKYFKGLGDGGTHVGGIWNTSGTLLASATFTEETASGWQTVTMSPPLAISAGVTYVAGFTSRGHYANTEAYFNAPKVSGPLTAPTGNGYYAYSTPLAYPATPSNGTNYWIDVVFRPTDISNQPPVAGDDSGFQVTQDTPLQIPAASLLANDTDPNGDPLSISAVGNPSGGTVAYNSGTSTVTFTPTGGYTGPASFTYTVSDGQGGSDTGLVSLTVVAPDTSVRLFSPSDVPANLNDPDTVQVNLGVRFSSSVAGTITGVRYYKGASDTGTHTGTLWSNTGTLLASATFVGESASGWQSVTFSTPVPITAGTIYVASFHSNGHYTSTPGYFTTPHVSGQLTAPSGNNGLYTYGNGNLFPAGSFNDTNYWVDVMFMPGTAVNQPPVANNDSGFVTQRDIALQITAAQLLANDTDPNGDTLAVTGVSAPSNGTVAFNPGTDIITFTPTASYTGPAGFTYAIVDGQGGTDSATVSLTVTDTTESVFAASSVPATVTVNDPDPVELGMKFSASTNGTVTGIRFYKGPQNTGVHTGRIWSSTGTLLGSATFSGETASGWQTAMLATAVPITAGTTYVVSYHSGGFYSANGNAFTAAVTNGSLTAPSSASSGGNGVYAYGAAGSFPSNTFNATNYWVDVLFAPGGTV